ncbi:hypothetical protein ETAA8_23610 [Anatilimnocola aggregata]|uniref:Uncharacterized protein n=1 Tax=Anatilimnocola aggregata TaxID=2528021 RepID=A0A517YAM5_9BACT|nr:hypothetical protein [Anatilimnocola aggregata]QDU27274.1 hypothetical protein ETAA8_23610 [Anatilimnocola aggregata]
MKSFHVLLTAAILGSLSAVEVPAQVPTSLAVATDEEQQQIKRIETALASKVSFDVKDLPLDELLQKVSQQCGIPILLRKSLAIAGIDSARPVTISLRDISLRAFLRNLLGELNLTFVVKDEVIAITTTDDSWAYPVTRIYPVKDLIQTRPTPSAKVEYDFGPLIELIISTVTITQESGASPVDGFDNALCIIITTRDEEHEQVERLLTTLRKSKARQQLAPPPEPIRSGK